MMNPIRGVLIALLACGTWLGCDSNPPATPDAGTDEPWDGSAVVLEEKGDFQDTGRLAPCTVVTANDAGTPLACGSFESFDLSGCTQRGTLSRLSPSGHYGLLTRSDPTTGSPLFGGHGFSLSTDGGTESVMGSSPLVEKRVDGQTFFVAGLRTFSDGGTIRFTYAGCAAESVERFTGCYQTCTNGGTRRTRGTFDGVRLERLSEPESSGGLTLASESRVELGLPVDIYVHKNHAYVVSVNSGPRTGGLTVFDVSNKAQPVLRKVVTIPNDSYWNGVWAKGNALYVASAAQGILVFDLSTPGKPVQVRAVPTPRASVHTVFVHENLLFGSSSDPDGVVLVFDVKNPLAPVALSRFRPNGFDPERSYGPHDMFAFENRLYANYWGAGYVIADLTAPDRPSELGRYRYAHSTSHANAVGRYGDRLIAFEGGEDWGAHLRVLDVTHPNDVRLLTEWRLHEHISIHNLVLVGTRLYIAHYQDGVRVLDVSVPEMPRPVAHYHTFRSSDPNRGDSFYDGAIGIRVPGDGFIYAVDTSRGLLILKEG
jgi:hypothetical protein